jgi:CheY-like chemotaxis protein
VAVESDLGQGTTFRVYLPRSVGEAGDKVAVEGGPPPRGTETILLVEDDDAVRAIARHGLLSAGYTVLEAASGPEALRHCEQHEGAIDLVVTDVVIPEMAGRVLTEHLAKLRPDTRILYMSGYMDDAVIRHGVLQSETAFLQKPFTPHALAAKVRDVLDR